MTVEAVFRCEYGRCVAALIRFLGDLDATEEADQLETPQTARAFLVPEAPVAQRIVRAKRNIKDTREGGAFRSPQACPRPF